MKKSKRIFLKWIQGFIAMISLTIILFLIIFKKPHVKSIDAKITKLSGTEALPVTIKVNFFNPNFFNFKYDSINYVVEYGNKLKAYGGEGKLNVINAKADKELKFPIKILFGPKHTPKGDSSIFTIHLKFRAHFGPLRVPIKYTFNATLPIFRKIYAQLDTLEINSLSFKKANISAVVTLFNPNKIEFNCKVLTYKFLIEKELIANGTTEVNKILKPKDSLKLSLPIEIASGKFFRYMILFRKKNENKPYTIAYDITLLNKEGTPDEKPFHLDIERKGTLKELQERTKGNKDKPKVKFKFKFK